MTADTAGTQRFKIYLKSGAVIEGRASVVTTTQHMLTKDFTSVEISGSGTFAGVTVDAKEVAAVVTL